MAAIAPDLRAVKPMFLMIGRTLEKSFLKKAESDITLLTLATVFLEAFLEPLREPRREPRLDPFLEPLRPFFCSRVHLLLTSCCKSLTALFSSRAARVLKTFLRVETCLLSPFLSVEIFLIMSLNCLTRSATLKILGFLWRRPLKYLAAFSLETVAFLAATTGLTSLAGLTAFVWANATAMQTAISARVMALISFFYAM